MKVTRDTVYTHDEYGEVLIVDVHHVYDEYDLESETGDLLTRVVRYSDDWDDYGPMPSSLKGTPVDEFRTAVGEPVRTAEFIQPHHEDDEN